MKKILFIFLVLICSNANSSEDVINNLKIIKKVYFKSEIPFDNCGIVHGKINFFSNGKSEEIYTCQETKSTHVWNGDWKDMSSSIYASSDRPKVSWIEIAYSEERKRSFLFETDFVKSTFYEKSINKGRDIFLYTDEKFNEKEKSKVVKKEKENPKDLSGNAIDCNVIQDATNGDINTKFHTQASILFKPKNKAKFAISGFKKVSGKIELFDILIPGEIVNYKVLDKKIVLKVDGIKKVHDPLGSWRRLLELGFGNKKETKGEIWIMRETLELTNLIFFDGIKCKLVNANDIQLFDKYYKFQSINNKLLQKQKEESESKNIL